MRSPIWCLLGAQVSRLRFSAIYFSICILLSSHLVQFKSLEQFSLTVLNPFILQYHVVFTNPAWIIKKFSLLAGVTSLMFLLEEPCVMQNKTCFSIYVKLYRYMLSIEILTTSGTLSFNGWWASFKG